MSSIHRRLADLAAGNLPSYVKPCKQSICMITNGDDFGTCFSVGCVANLNLFATAFHTLKHPGEYFVSLGGEHRTCRLEFADKNDDIAIVSTPLYSNSDPLPILKIENALEQGKVVSIYGNHNYGHISDLSVFVGRISATDAENSAPPAGFGDWMTGHFFIIDRVSDNGVSGAPVLSNDGTVIGMVAASTEYAAVTFALGGTYVRDAVRKATQRIEARDAYRQFK